MKVLLLAIVFFATALFSEPRDWERIGNWAKLYRSHEQQLQEFNQSKYQEFLKSEENYHSTIEKQTENQKSWYAENLKSVKSIKNNETYRLVFLALEEENKRRNLFLTEFKLSITKEYSIQKQSLKKYVDEKKEVLYKEGVLKKFKEDCEIWEKENLKSKKEFQSKIRDLWSSETEKMEEYERKRSAIR